MAVIYVVFMLLFLALYAVRRGRLKPHDALANALSLLREERDGGLDAETRRQALALLDDADPADPLVPLLRDRVERMPVRERRILTPYHRWRNALAEWYRRVVARRWFSVTVIVIMAAYCLTSLGTLLTVVGDSSGVDNDPGNVSVAHWVQGISSGVTALLIVIGFVVRRRSRASSYRWFKAAVLVSLLVTQVFVFYSEQFAALSGVVLDLLLYAGLTYMIGREEAEGGDAVQKGSRPMAFQPASR